MKFPSILRFPRPGFWALHVVVIPSVFAGGIALGIFHATGHGGRDAELDAHATHAAPAAVPQGHDGHATPSPPPGDNPIRDEMIDLQAAYDTLNRAVILGDATGVGEAFHRVHARKQTTAAAIAAGTARPPRNGDRIDAFVARDEAFHALLETTVEAAGRSDLPTLKRMTTELRDGCIGCHEEFRGAP